MNKKKSTQPAEKDMLKRVGSKAGLWTEFRAYLAGHYEHKPVLSVGKKEYDWTIRYRKSGKTLVTLMPEENGFCVLIVLGKDEVAKTKELKLNAYVKKVFQNAKQFHDGRWLWLRPVTKQDIEATKNLLAVKRKPMIKTLQTDQKNVIK